MSVENAILLGLMQGITEFLPVSSSGHLSILSNLFGLTTPEDGHLFFDVLLHCGTLLALLLVYWKEFRSMGVETLALMGLGPEGQLVRRHRPGARLLMMLLIGTLPLALVLPIRVPVRALVDHSIFIGLALILSGCLLYVADRMRPGDKTVAGMTLLDALLIGLCQCVAVIPGLSRPGTTLTAGIAVGLDRRFAVKFSLLLSVPAVLAANLLRLFEALRAGVDWSCLPAYLIGAAAAMISGVGAIYLLQAVAKRGKFGGFAYYCWVLGALSIILTMIF